MARTKSSKPRKPAAAVPATAPRTTEDLSDDQLQALAFAHKSKFQEALAAKKKADADFKNACKIARAELGLDAVETIKDLIAFETEEGEAKQSAAVRRILRSAKWAGAALGTQFEMFDGPDRTPAADRAFDEGKRAGMKGEPRKCDYDPSTEQYRRYMDGYSAGQQALMTKGFAAPQKDGAPADPADRAPHGAGAGSFRAQLHEQHEGVRAQVIGDQPSTAQVSQH